MPLRDHFRSPVNDKHRWDAVHGWWPAEITRHLFDLLPAGYRSGPRINLISDQYDAMIGDDRPPPADLPPTLTVEADLGEQDEYEVRVYDEFNQLVAAIELVSPSSKDRPASRAQCLYKVESLLREGVCVAVMDIVTIPQFNLYAELLARIGQADPRLGDPPAPLSAVTLRSRKPPKKRRGVLDT